MAQYFEVHPETPQQRLINQAVQTLADGGVIAYPTDSSYALGCRLGDKAALDRIREIRRLDNSHNFTMACKDLKDIGTYAKMENYAYRLLKSHTPGPYTFILRATSEVPRRLQHPKRKTIGIRVPDHPASRALLNTLGEPLMSVTLQLPGDDMPLDDPEAIRERIGKLIDAVVAGGPTGGGASTVIDLTGEAAEVIREGVGDTRVFQSA
ncbi:MAG: threonylcarbamoyl-AMP synthase [Halorhodospira halophila]|uniref:L-threonylcarbamoyladenylate synthase n=1 Tax=Halorhodospira TaxID=85108 RepID=UPI001913C11B|nr:MULTISPECIES: L-threonylcarbamoyladenylate synthase [Halorhodospira]MBK5935262.1 threonylcarbamoyl-AMP synthase [Halorhodospira halophila]MBK5942906.1 threonylcarbamoyl-AMP synthase [Halorhodospira halophila]MCC3750454.1 threonylcarbamoyl-AMP synthase [Halorhodospira halophila]MCG5528726.1 threonylcarbamoyl-AMP synthase [Halorhodospira halophila]MCG5539529.1 threonylcarbamoyl-AMP synthase [Halorhodospira sp. 9622]